MPTPDSKTAVSIALQPPRVLLVLTVLAAGMAVVLVAFSGHSLWAKWLFSLLAMAVCSYSVLAWRRQYRGQLVFDGCNWFWQSPSQRHIIYPVQAFVPFTRWLLLKFAHEQQWRPGITLLLTPRELSAEQARALRVLIRTGYF